MLERHSTTTALVVAGISILQDSHGRYNLNTLHQASGSGETKEPHRWTRLAGTKALQQALEGQLGYQAPDVALETVHGGDRRGTYAHELLAVEYAGWISPAFRLKVNQAFIDYRNGRLQPVQPMTTNRVLMATIQHLVAIEERVLVVEQDVSQVKADIEALKAVRPPAQKMTPRQYLATLSQPFLPRTIFDVFRAHCRAIETPQRWTPPGASHAWSYYSVETLDVAYAQATRQLSFHGWPRR